MGLSFRKSCQCIRIFIMLIFVLSLWGCNTGSESGGEAPKAGAIAIAKAAADKPVINETLSSAVQNRYIKGTAGSRMIYTDAGGQDTYTILPILCGDVELIDNDASTVNFPAGLNISSSQFMSDKVLFTINGFTLTFSGRPSLFNFVFAGTPLSNATGVSKTFEQTAQVFGTTVPLPGQPFNESTITGIIQGNGTPKPTSHVPTISNITASPTGRAVNNAVINLTATASDADGDAMTYSWTASSGAIIGTGATAKWTAPASGSGTATISATVKDQANTQATKSVSISYGTNSAPVILNLSFSRSEGSSAISYGASLEVEATDADGDALIYTWTASAGTITGTGSTVTWSPPASGRGAAIIEVIVKDTSNAQDTISSSIIYGRHTAPVISSLTGTAVNYAIINLVATAYDPDGDALRSYSWKASAGSIVGHEATAEWTAPASGSGTAIISVTVYDIYDVQESKSVLVAYSPAAVLSRKLNDTGITKWANGTTNALTSPQIDYPGQDADYGRDKTNNDNSEGKAGFSFCKIGTSGEILPVVAANWSAVLDNVTGLIWENKTDDNGLHDKDWKYSWYEPDSTKNGGSVGVMNGGECGGTITSADTWHFVKAVNEEKFCGYTDWRLPTLEELESIVCYGETPAIDTIFFQNTPPEGASSDLSFWSSSPYANTEYGYSAWYVEFFCGNNQLDFKNWGTRVRLVRSRL